MKNIILLTDFGLDDNFVGTMKGVILNINNKVSLIDLTHNVEPHDILKAGFLLKGSYKYFPKGSIFLVVVDPGVGTQRDSIIIKTRNYYFVGPDNGVMSIAALEDGIQKIVAIENKRYMLEDVSDTFHGRDVFAPACAYLSKGQGLSSFGRGLQDIKRIYLSEPEAAGNILKGEIICIDRFGNLVTNINKRLFLLFIEGRRFAIEIQDRKIDSISRSYQQVDPGGLLSIFGSTGFLEISVREGNAKEYLKAEKGQEVRIIKS